MITLGISGSFETFETPVIGDIPNWFGHDASAAIIKDGKIVAAVEQERLDRIKHSNQFPIDAIVECLKIAQVEITDVDKIAFYFEELNTDTGLGLQYIERKNLEVETSRSLINKILVRKFGEEVRNIPIEYVRHHDTHAIMAAENSGFDSSLVIVIDGNGEDESTSIYSYIDGVVRSIYRYPVSSSLGRYYLDCISLLGYERFDEYKVMGLASYGKQNQFDELFEELINFEEGGKVSFNHTNIPAYFLDRGILPRRENEYISENHQNFAHSIQKYLEKMAFHIISFWSQKLSQRNLCLSGGVALNCTLNGKLAFSELFDNIFVHPASHDGGSAVGAAMCAMYPNARINGNKIENVYLGPDINSKYALEIIDRNQDIIEIINAEDEFQFLANEISNGKIIGWARGRMEYGPRALGSRSILADPRPIESKYRTNQIIKQRESYRPFAPMVLVDEISDWFLVPDCKVNLEYMVFNLPVVKKNQQKLAAITHIDNTARVQVVGEYNKDIYQLIKNFKEITGVPVLLNTSFNVNAEPIVCDAYDAIQCFLLTDLDYLVVGDFIIKKRIRGDNLYELLRPIKKEFVTTIKKVTSESCSYYINTATYSEWVTETELSCFDAADGIKTISQFLLDGRIREGDIISAYKRLLSKRLLNLAL
ncbi:carbamoyltransferase C-terminal domain-containing protein [Photorhabdus sp. P32]|uniref:Carbamoyltransferase n=1 Tax=Photorhabdus luminescens TaxID=29488 RepID=A0A1G5PPX2_PHOLU|nr:carbamoyltransferase C-terminal domain-containing protein [Photorhabdus luminescens]SCZ51386.1 carbamoyltransferase [Photorhabdus luminescens]